MIISILASILISAIWCFCYRCRGGALSQGGDFHQRIIFWSLPVGVVMAAFAFASGAVWGSIAVGIGSGIMAYIGLMVGHSSTQNNTAMDNIAGLGVGMFCMLLIASPMMLYAYITHTFTWFLATWWLSGAWQGVTYIIGNWIGNSTNIKIGNDNFLTSGSEWGEFLTPLLPALTLGLFGF